MTVVVVIEAVVIALLAVLVAGLLRSHADILRALHELGVGDGGPPAAASRRSGAAATDVVGVKPGGGALKVGVAGAGHDTVLAFLSSGCAACADLWRAFDEPVALPGTDTRLVVVTKGPTEESEAHITGLAPAAVPVVMSSDAWRDYAVPVTPYFVLVDGSSGRVVGEGAANGWEQVASLLARATGDAAATRRRTGSFAQREADTDTELLSAGLTPGHPSLYHGARPEGDG